MDILNQSLNQEVLTLNDNVKGLFNDRRMALREQEKTIDSAVRMQRQSFPLRNFLHFADAQRERHGR